MFDAWGRTFAFFPRTGDTAILTDSSAQVLRRIENGETLRSIRADLLEDDVDLRDDLDALEQSGLLQPASTLSPEERVAARRSLHWHQARNLMFLVTEACNLACTYCYEKNQGVHERAKTLKQVDARRIIDRYFAESTRRDALTITFFGGEPLLNPQVIRDTVAYAKERARATGQNVGFTMTSNLTLLDEDMAEFLAVERFHVMVSIDGDEQDNDRHRVTKNGKGTYATTVANLQLLSERMRAHGVRLPKLRATLTAQSKNPLDVEAHLRSLGSPHVEIGDTHGTVERSDSYDRLGEEDPYERPQAKLLRQYLDAALRGDPDTPELSGSMLKGLHRIHDEVSRTQPKRAIQQSLCGVCRNMKAVTPNGDLYPCHRYVGMDAYKMGNAHQGGLDRQRVDRYYRALQDVFDESCAPCFLRHLCGGQCPWYLSREDGTVAVPDEHSCDRIRVSHEQMLGFYAILLDARPDLLAELVQAPEIADQQRT